MRTKRLDGFCASSCNALSRRRIVSSAVSYLSLVSSIVSLYALSFSSSSPSFFTFRNFFSDPDPHASELDPLSRNGVTTAGGGNEDSPPPARRAAPEKSFTEREGEGGPSGLRPRSVGEIARLDMLRLARVFLSIWGQLRCITAKTMTFPAKIAAGKKEGGGKMLTSFLSTCPSSSSRPNACARRLSCLLPELCTRSDQLLTAHACRNFADLQKRKRNILSANRGDPCTIQIIWTTFAELDDAGASLGWYCMDMDGHCICVCVKCVFAIKVTTTCVSLPCS